VDFGPSSAYCGRFAFLRTVYFLSQCKQLQHWFEREGRPWKPTTVLTVPLPTKTDAVRVPQLVQHVAPLGATASLNPCIPSHVFYSPHICCVSIVRCEQAGLRPGSTHSVALPGWCGTNPPFRPIGARKQNHVPPGPGCVRSHETGRPSHQERRPLWDTRDCHLSAIGQGLWG
jgi:hypothetical protein